MVGVNDTSAAVFASHVSRRLKKHGYITVHRDHGPGPGIYVTRDTLLLEGVGAYLNIYQGTRAGVEDVRDHVVPLIDGWREYAVDEPRILGALWNVQIRVRAKEKK